MRRSSLNMKFEKSVLSMQEILKKKKFLNQNYYHWKIN